MYALVEDIEAYPQFLPWCARRARVRERRARRARRHPRRAERGVRYGVHHRERAAARRADRRCGWSKGRSGISPGDWRFVPLARAGLAGSSSRWRTSLRAAASSPGSLAPVFDGIADTMVDAFVRRADAALWRRLPQLRWCDATAGAPDQRYAVSWSRARRCATAIAGAGYCRSRRLPARSASTGGWSRWITVSRTATGSRSYRPLRGGSRRKRAAADALEGAPR